MNFARRTLFASVSISSAIALAAGCSSSSSGGGTPAEDGGGSSSSGGSSSGGSSSGGSSSGGSSSGASSSGGSSSSSSGAGDSGGEASTDSGGCSGATPVALTVKNYLSWCTVTVAGHALATIPADQTVCVASGSVSLSATANTGFVLGPWHGTSGDHDAGDSASSTTVTPSGSSACVWICCPFTNGTGCPTTNQCP